MTTVPPLEWRKSTWSAQEADCVEVARTLKAVRDTKNRSLALTVDLRPMLAALRRGELD